jgi:peptidoglycan/xylan/chitin deacetylase (PgdA/CDA1 family)
MNENRIAITIDCEEWNSPHIRGKKDKDHNNTSFSRLGNEALLKLFRKYNVKATFFVTGFYADHEPDSVKKLISEGHEVGAHGYEHHYRGREFDIEADVVKAKRTLERITGKKVLGFRAPQVQFSKRLLGALSKAGYMYDSSLHPAHLPGYYDHRKLPLKIHQLGDITEIPVAVMPTSRWPVVWMFMRMLGKWWTQIAVEKLLRKKIVPNLYVHSWEFIKMRNRHVPFYFNARTGRSFLKTLEKFIVDNKKKGREFVKLGELV